jgi:transcriptional regulator with XRE-family HTH domain
MGIGERVLRVAKDRGISQTQLSQQLGLNPSTVSLWGREGRSPNIDDIPNIARILGVSLEYLFTGEGESQNLETAHDDNQIVDKIPTEQVVDSAPTKADLIGFIKSQQDMLVTQTNTIATQSGTLDKQSDVLVTQSDTLASQHRLIETMVVGGGRGSG